MTADRDDKIGRLRRSGRTYGEIAAETGMTRSAVAGVLHRLIRDGKVERAPATNRRFTIRPELFADLEREARSRGRKTSGLIEELLRRIVHDDLIPAILDEERQQ